MPVTNKPAIAYIGPVAFPTGGAAARRMLGIAQTLQLNGFSVVIGSGQMPVNKVNEIPEFKGLRIFSLGERNAENSPALLKYFRYFNMGKKTVKWLDKLDIKPKAVILYSGYSAYFRHLLPWCKRNGIPLIFDAVEWYDPPSLIRGLLSPYYWNIELAMRHYCVRSKNIIAISRYLENYYSKKACNTIRVPPTLDTSEIKPTLTVNHNHSLTIGYTGTPGHKDLFNHYLESVIAVQEDGGEIKLKVAGVTEKQLLNYPAMTKRGMCTLPKYIETLGMTTQNEAIRLIRSVDYSVLLRPQKRYANAGFPTKVVESLAVGTPVICNLTSDLSDYIHDGMEGIICQDHSVQSLINAFNKALKLTEQKREKMRIASRQRAIESFDYRKYSKQFITFIDKAINDVHS